MTVTPTDADPTLAGCASVVRDGVCHAAYTHYDQDNPNGRQTVECDRSVRVDPLHEEMPARGEVDAPMCPECWPEEVLDA